MAPSSRLDADLPAIAGDANTLQQVVLNLVTNAWGAVDPGGENERAQLRAAHLETNGTAHPQ